MESVGDSVMNSPIAHDSHHHDMNSQDSQSTTIKTDRDISTLGASQSLSSVVYRGRKGSHHK